MPRQLWAALDSDWIVLAYQTSMVWIAIACVVRVPAAPAAVVTDLVVELGEESAGPIQETLRATLGDPTLRVGYRTSSGRFVDGAGDTVGPPGDGRILRMIGDQDEHVAVLVHDASIDADARLVRAVETAARLRAANATLTAEINQRLGELASSRRPTRRRGRRGAS